MNHEILADGKTVWVNSGVDGNCLARFGRGGIDIHSTMAEQMEGGKQCPLCTHRQPTELDWGLFQSAMLKFYGVEIKEEWKPKWVVGEQPGLH